MVFYANDNKRSLEFYGVHVLAPLAIFAIYLLASFRLLYVFEANDYDYGLFSSLIWNFAHGNGWYIPLYEGQIRVNFLADHFAMIVPLLSPLFMIFESPYTLSFIHACALGATFVLVPVLTKTIFASHHRGDYLKYALFLLVALSVFKGFTAAWRSQVHMTNLVMPFILCALIALHKNARFWAVLWCILVITAQERAALAVFGIGMYAVLITRQPRFGLLLCAFAAAYFFAIVKLVIPAFYAEGGYLYDSLINFSYQFKRKCLFLINFVVYWFFLPLAGKNALLTLACATPLLGISLASQSDQMFSFSVHYQDMPTMFLLAASAHGLAWLSSHQRFACAPKTLKACLALVCILFSAYFAKHSLPIRKLVFDPVSQGVVQLNEALRAYDALGQNISVYATSGIGPRFTMRKQRFALTPQRAVEPFASSMVFLASEASIFPHTNLDELLALLDGNPSLQKMAHNNGLHVYRSRDLPEADAE